MKRQPKQDAAGNWVCPICGAARFSKQAQVFGHLRHCRAGKPYRPPRQPVPAVQLPAQLALQPIQPDLSGPAALQQDAYDPDLIRQLVAQNQALAAQVASLQTAQDNHIAHLSEMANSAPAVVPWLWVGGSLLVGALTGLLIARGIGCDPAGGASRRAKKCKKVKTKLEDGTVEEELVCKGPEIEPPNLEALTGMGKGLGAGVVGAAVGKFGKDLATKAAGRVAGKVVDSVIRK